MSKQKIYDFKGTEIDVHWDQRLCIHIAECGQSEGDLFDGERQPWCVPDQSTVEEVAEVCERCPSGALTYTHHQGSHEEQSASENTVQISYNGPLFVLGDLEIDGASDDMPGVKYRAALCRCGKSANKPFCDNSHLKAGFEDYGSVGQKGSELTSKGGPLKVTAAKDGPLIVEGNLTIVASSGRAAWQGEKAFLCRCGASSNKPFCDGSHKAIGFSSDD